MSHDTESNNSLSLFIELEVGDAIALDSPFPVTITAITETGLVRYETVDGNEREVGKATFLERIESADSINVLSGDE